MSVVASAKVLATLTTLLSFQAVTTTVFPRIVRARSINFTAVMLCSQFEGALYSRARFNTD